MSQVVELKPKENKGQRRQLEKRESLLDAIEELFLEYGFQSMTVDRLAAQLKCSKRALYQLAPSKQELVLLVVDRWLRRIRSIGRKAALSQQGPQRRIRHFTKPGVTETQKASRQFLDDLRTNPGALALLNDHQRERSEMLQEIIEDGIAKGRIRPFHSHLVAEFFLAAVGRINDPDFLEKADIGFSEAIEELYRLLFEGLLE